MITTWCGDRVDPFNMAAEDINIDDIAHSLSRICRYGGHVDNYLSVARHSIWVQSRLRNIGCGNETQMWGLLHDATEAYLGDVTSPIKYAPEMAAFVAAEARLHLAVHRIGRAPADRVVGMVLKHPLPCRADQALGILRTRHCCRA